MPGVTRNKFRKPKFAIWKVSKKHFKNLTKFIKNNKIIIYNKQWKIFIQSKKVQVKAHCESKLSLRIFINTSSAAVSDPQIFKFNVIFIFSGNFQRFLNDPTNFQNLLKASIGMERKF